MLTRPQDGGGDGDELTDHDSAIGDLGSYALVDYRIVGDEAMMRCH